MKAIIKAHYTPFDIGQKVWLEGTNLTLSYNKKIKTKREGPFKVLEKLTPVTYQLELLKKWKMFHTFHAALLMPYKENNVHGPIILHQILSKDKKNGKSNESLDTRSNVDVKVHGEPNTRLNGK